MPQITAHINKKHKACSIMTVTSIPVPRMIFRWKKDKIIEEEDDDHETVEFHKQQ